MEARMVSMAVRGPLDRPANKVFQARLLSLERVVQVVRLARKDSLDRLALSVLLQM